MSVDFFECPGCSECCSENSGFIICGTCDRWFCESCGAQQIKRFGRFEEEHHRPKECIECSTIIIRDEDIIAHLLSEIGLTREQVVVEIEERRKNPDE